MTCAFQCILHKNIQEFLELNILKSKILQYLSHYWSYKVFKGTLKEKSNCHLTKHRSQTQPSSINLQILLHENHYSSTFVSRQGYPILSWSDQGLQSTDTITTCHALLKWRVTWNYVYSIVYWLYSKFCRVTHKRWDFETSVKYCLVYFFWSIFLVFFLVHFLVYFFGLH